ncbi:methylenetetrahydrofolate reductase [Corynebacterium pseudodiphtheriticum]|uniref:methylenetetrahydrofolate reductase n=1 Tax=Corynebacterium pseudodiphtheriticum TaxID=37637 RepID=UPI00234C89D4|nr:methylenetetrahydrofolate reductase [Corynebacterium pseudodiphtheriticum]MDC7088841.1 methylenetetrahydrofolate reductase [Corynebacterium pseudodiphtheriticum]
MAPRVSASAPLDDSSDNPDNAESTEPRTRSERTALSFEVIPPRHDADEKKISHLLETLQSYRPDYISVTSSCRSGWLDGTAKFISRIDRETNMRTLAHLACTAGTKQEMVAWINRLIDSGVRGLLALRGDLPEGEVKLPADHLQYADELVRLIREVEGQQAARFAAGRLAVAVASYPNGHYQARTDDENFDVLLSKQRSGADLAISQLFFEAEDFLKFRRRAELAGIRIPQIPGIMPITSVRRLRRMAEFSSLPVPEHLVRRLESARDERAEGIAITAELVQAMVDNDVGSLHIYTHNNAEVTQELLDAVGIRPPTAPSPTAPG